MKCFFFFFGAYLGTTRVKKKKKSSVEITINLFSVPALSVWKGVLA